MKKLPSMSLVVALGATVAACDSDPGAQVAQRDVYTGPHALENCVADWGNQEMCQTKLTQDDAKRIAEANRSGGSSGHPIFIYNGGYGVYGPSYPPGNRVATYNGQTYTPTLTRATQTAAFSGIAPGAKPSAFSKPRPVGMGPTPSRPVTVTSRGGFGATGHGVSSGG